MARISTEMRCKFRNPYLFHPCSSVVSVVKKQGSKSNGLRHEKVQSLSGSFAFLPQRVMHTSEGCNTGRSYRIHVNP
jgi:hypothetical protein